MVSSAESSLLHLVAALGTSICSSLLTGGERPAKHIVIGVEVKVQYAARRLPLAPRPLRWEDAGADYAYVNDELGVRVIKVELGDAERPHQT